ncbi:MAG: hypothetical protein ABL308_09670 [Oceanicaulis sp.]
MNITVRTQLIAGFGLLGLLVLAIGAAGVLGVGAMNASKIALTETGAQSRLVSATKLDLADARLAGFNWRSRGEEVFVERFDTAVGKLTGEVGEAGLADILPLADNYSAAFAQARQAAAIRTANLETVHDEGRATRQNLTEISETAYADGDAEAAYYAGRAQERLLLGRLYVDRYAVSGLAENAERAATEFASALDALNTLLPFLQNPQRRALTTEARDRLERAASAFETVLEQTRARDAALAQMDSLGPEMTVLAEAACWARPTKSPRRPAARF